MVVSQIKLVGMLSVLTVTSVMAQSSCVQLNATELSSCPCDGATLTFTLEGKTTLAAHTVNLVLVLDGSSSVLPSGFALEQGFAMDAVAAFADRNLFDNGGMASYVQYAKHLASSASFDSPQDFNEFVGTDMQARGGTTTSIGIKEGTRLLGDNPASASFMIVITDGKSGVIPATKSAADAARAEGTTVFAVGVGSETDAVELLAIGGDQANVFEVEEFDLLNAALDSILSSNGGIVIPCESTGATVTIEFGVTVDSATFGTIKKKTVTFSVADLESTLTDFEVMLDVCNEVPGGSIIVSADYEDDQENTPDLSLLANMVVGNDLCAAPTPAPIKVPPPTPTAKPTRKLKDAPSRGESFEVGKATDAEYLGCYVPVDKLPPMNGPVTTWNEMTAQACADSCFCLGWEYFATANGSECHCGSSEPTKKKKKGVCDYQCAGDGTTECGGAGSISVYKSNKDDDDDDLSDCEQHGRLRK